MVNIVQKYLDRALNKSEVERRRLAFMVAITLTGLVLIVWVVNILLINGPQTEAPLVVVEDSTETKMFDFSREIDRIKSGLTVVGSYLK